MDDIATTIIMKFKKTTIRINHQASSTGGSHQASTSRGTTTLPPLPLLYYPPLIPVDESDPPENRPTHSPTIRPPRRRTSTGTPPPGKLVTFPPPYPWAGDRSCIVHTLTHLYSQNIFIISGDARCKKCEQAYKIEYNLEEKYREVFNFIAENIENMNDRAPRIWMSPALLNCGHYNERNSLKPVISEKKKSINWLFLFLGQMLGCCTLDQLRYYCKHSNIHRTGAKDRLVFYTYMDLCNQLQPNGPLGGN
ncbi:hypothetical protein ACS0TY_001743 [Phlomoides rotata]